MAKEFVCKSCGHIGEAKGGKRGSFWAELTMWSFILPGIFYSIWRRIDKRRCSLCEGTSLADLNSPYGKVALEKFYLNNIKANSKPN